VNLQTTIYSLADRGWSQRRIARELGINRETVGRYLRLAEKAKAAISTSESDGDSESKPAILTAVPEEDSEAKPAISTPGS
jgi:predicted transcriptional regulator